MRGMNPEAGEPPAEVYRRHLESGELGFQRCAGCGAAVFYPRVLCPGCGKSDLTWETSSGRGVVYATTAVHRWEGNPYNVVLVDLEEGFRMMSRIEGVPAERVEVGTRVKLRLDPTDAGPVPVFVPRNEDR
jgi:uncharacterized protein